MKQAINIPSQLKEHLISIKDIIPYEKNPRKHSRKSIDELKISMMKDGFINPILIDEKNRLIAGHGRTRAATELGMDKIPYIRLYVTEEEYLRIMMSDNKIAELSKWDKGLLHETMEYLESIKTAEDFKVPGFTDEDLDKIFGTIVKETLDTKADFGDAGEVDIDDNARVTSMTFKLTVAQHKRIKGVIDLIMRENDFETSAEALMLMISKFKGPNRTIRRNTKE